MRGKRCDHVRGRESKGRRREKGGLGKQEEVKRNREKWRGEKMEGRR